MTPEQTYWGQIGVSAYVLDPDGETVWRLDGERVVQGRQQVLLTTAAGEQRIVWRPADITPVTRMVRTHAECELLVAQMLGAALEARVEGRVVRCQPVSGKLAVESHLFLFHGVVLGSRKFTPKQFGEIHREAHADAAQGLETHGYIHHTHEALRPLGATA